MKTSKRKQSANRRAKQLSAIMRGIVRLDDANNFGKLLRESSPEVRAVVEGIVTQLDNYQLAPFTRKAFIAYRIFRDADDLERKVLLHAMNAEFGE